MSPEQLLGQLERDGGAVISDLEAGVGSLLRMGADHIDVTLVVVEASVKSIEAAKRAATIASALGPVIVVANSVRGDPDIEMVRAALPDHDVHPVPYDPIIRRADRDGVAPIEYESESPGVAAITALGDKILQLRSPSN